MLGLALCIYLSDMAEGEPSLPQLFEGDYVGEDQMDTTDKGGLLQNDPVLHEVMRVFALSLAAMAKELPTVDEEARNSAADMMTATGGDAVDVHVEGMVQPSKAEMLMDVQSIHSDLSDDFVDASQASHKTCKAKVKKEKKAYKEKREKAEAAAKAATKMQREITCHIGTRHFYSCKGDGTKEDHGRLLYPDM